MTHRPTTISGTGAAKTRSAYQAAMWEALLAGFYIPELMDCYYRQDNFQSPHLFVQDFGY